VPHAIKAALMALVRAAGRGSAAGAQASRTVRTMHRCDLDFVARRHIDLTGISATCSRDRTKPRSG
jgi:hypothetical protein